MNISEFLAKKLVKPIHAHFVSQRRTRVLARLVAEILPANEHLNGLDVGCGSGKIAQAIQTARPEIKMTGMDVTARSDATINVVRFDGTHIPFADNSYDFSMLIHVLHHLKKPELLLDECVRVSRKYVVIADHFCQSRWDRLRLSIMDWIGNRGYDVPLPYNYLTKSGWQDIYNRCCLQKKKELCHFKLYRQPFSSLFDDKLHFVSQMEISEKGEK